MRRLYFIITLLMLLAAIPLTEKISIGMQEEDGEFTRQRGLMVREQIEARGIKDKSVLGAMRKVKRHLLFLGRIGI